MTDFLHTSRFCFVAREVYTEINDCVLFVSQGTLSATVVKSSYQPEPPLTYIHVFGVASNPTSVTVNGSPISSYSYNTTTKVGLKSVLVVIRSNGNKNDPSLVIETPRNCRQILLSTCVINKLPK